MKKLQPEKTAEYLTRLASVAKTLTQDQVNACAWVMGSCGWTTDEIVKCLLNDAKNTKKSLDIP